RSFAGLRKPVYFAGAGVLPVVMIALMVVPLLNPSSIELANPDFARSRPAEPFSRATVSVPDGNVAGSHDATNWTSYGGSNLSNKFTPSAQITPENVSQLEVAWHFHTGDNKPEDAEFAYAFQNTPLMVEDTVYICTPSQIVIAVDAAKGTEKWRFDPEVDRKAMRNIAAST